MWIPPEITDPVVFHQPTRKNIGYYRAVRLRDGKFVYRRETEKFNGETFLAFLRQSKRAACRSGWRVVVIVDNAPYHHGRFHKDWREQNSKQFQLDFLPPYSPELNPIERVWKLTRRKCLHNLYFDELSKVTHAVETQFTVWRKLNKVLYQLCAFT